MAGQRAPFPTNPEDFASDTRVSFSKAADNYILEDENGEEWEWFSRTSKWVPMMDEALAEQQRAAYKMPGVDDDEPAVDPSKKRKAVEAENENAKKQKSEKSKERVNTAIYVESLPRDVNEEELFECFSRYGVIAESIDDNKPRIKMYYNEDGEFNGDALIVYFRPESVNLAINMLDDSDFRLGVSGVKGKMRVKVADQSYKVQKDRPAASQDAKKKGTSANRDREKAIKKAEEMNRRLNDWDEDDVSVMHSTSNNWNKVVVLKHIFTLEDLEHDEDEDEDESMADFLIRDIREQCSKFGQVENAVLFDAEPEGVMTVRFTNGSAAQACVKKMHGRRLEGRLVEARIADGTERFQKRGAAAEKEE